MSRSVLTWDHANVDESGDGAEQRLVERFCRWYASAQLQGSQDAYRQRAVAKTSHGTNFDVGETTSALVRFVCTCSSKAVATYIPKIQRFAPQTLSRVYVIKVP